MWLKRLALAEIPPKLSENADYWRFQLRKTGHYRRAAHVRGDEMTLEQALGQCNDGYPEEGHPIFPYTEELDCVVASHAVVHGRQ